MHGYLDVRGGWAGEETGWNDGGLGKTRFGGGDGFASADAALAARWQVTPALFGVDAGAVPARTSRRRSGVLDAYLQLPARSRPRRGAGR